MVIDGVFRLRLREVAFDLGDGTGFWGVTSPKISMHDDNSFQTKFFFLFF